MDLSTSTPTGRTRLCRLTATLAVALLVAFLLEGWAAERPSLRSATTAPAPAGPTTDDARARAEKAGIDIDGIVERASHAVTPVPGGGLEVGDEDYRARFGAEGFSLELGGHVLGFALDIERPGPWRADLNAAVRDVSAGVTERVSARDGEVEWDLVLARPPAGAADFAANASLSGLTGMPTRNGDVWRLPLGDGASARMGEVVVLDADGRELHRTMPEVTRDGVRLVVPAAALAGAAYPVTVDPVVGPEGPTAGATQASNQNGTAVAWNGSNYFVAWTDERSAGDANILGTRVTATGAVLEPNGLLISTAGNGQSFPAITSNGAEFFVVWEDFRNGNGDIFGARVDNAGTVLDATGIAISVPAGTSGQFAPDVAWNGTDYLVVWSDTRVGGSTAPDIYGSRVSSTGTVLDGTGFAIGVAASRQGVPKVAWNGTDWLVVWEDGRLDAALPDIYGTRVTSAASVLDPGGIAISPTTGENRAPKVASDGTNVLVVWHATGTGFDVVGARVDNVGTVLDATPISIRVAAPTSRFPAVTWNGTNFLVVWEEDNILGARVTSAGVPDASAITVSSVTGTQTEPVVAWNGTEHLAIWEDHRFANEDIFGSRVTATPAAVDTPNGIILTQASNDEVDPAVSWNGSEYLLVWEDFRSGAANVNIIGTRVTEAGVVLTPTGFSVASATGNQTNPVVEWDSSGVLAWVVVWQDRRSGTSDDIYANFVTNTGSVAPGASTGIAISTAANDQQVPAVIHGSGTQNLVVWDDLQSGTDDDVWSASLSSSGSVGIPFSVSAAIGDQQAPRVAWNGTNFLVAWDDTRSGVDSDIYGARVSSGVVLEPSGIPISTAVDDQVEPAVASWGDRWFVVWQDGRSGVDDDIYGSLVTGAGVVFHTNGTPISTAPGDQSQPDLAVRYHFLVVWRDRRSGVDDAIFGARVAINGTVQDASGFAISDLPGDEANPDVVGAPSPGWRVIYNRPAPSPGIQRPFLRSVLPK